MKKKIALLLCVPIILASLLTGCSLGNKKLSILSLTDTTVDAVIDKISGKTLTLTLGTLNTSGSGSMNNSTGQPPEMPNGSGGTQGSSGQQPPEMPSGDSNSGQNSSGGNQSDSTGQQPPEMPGGSGGTQGGGFGGNSGFTKGNTVATLVIKDESILTCTKDGKQEKASLSDLKQNDIIEITINKKSKITAISILDLTIGGGSDSGAPTDYDAVKTYDSDTSVSEESIESTGKDENAVLVTNSATVTFKNLMLSRTSSDSTGGDSSSFYGVGAAMLVIDGTAFVNGGTIETDAAGGTGIFSYKSGKVYVAGTTITTQKDTSGGIHVAGGGTLYAWDLVVNTSGNSAAAIRSDRGGGTMVIDGGNYTSNGNGSPAVYCTANISINQAKLTATASEAICIEGKNNLHLFDCDVTGNMKDDDQNDTTWTVIVYQSMSGDSEVGNSTFHMVGGSLTSQNGGLIYTTNTESDILLNNVKIQQASDSKFFLACVGNQNKRGWGTVGKNGAQCNFTGINQQMSGNVLWDSASTLKFYATQGSCLTGAILQDETNAGSGGSGSCSVFVDASSSWIVTGNSTVTHLAVAGTLKDSNGKTVSIVGTDGTKFVSGNSEFTITVSDYTTSVDVSGASTQASFSEVQISKPDALK